MTDWIISAQDQHNQSIAAQLSAQDELNRAQAQLNEMLATKILALQKTQRTLQLLVIALASLPILHVVIAALLHAWGVW